MTGHFIIMVDFILILAFVSFIFCGHLINWKKFNLSDDVGVWYNNRIFFFTVISILKIVKIFENHLTIQQVYALYAHSRRKIYYTKFVFFYETVHHYMRAKLYRINEQSSLVTKLRNGFRHITEFTRFWYTRKYLRLKIIEVKGCVSRTFLG